MAQRLPGQQISSVPTIDLSLLLSQSPSTRARVIKEIGTACQRFGLFSVTNHGISELLIEKALDANSRFFDLPTEEKGELISTDISKPVRFGTIIDERGKGMCTRDFLKLYAYPLEDWIGLWPQNPPDYRETMETYATEVRKLGIQIFLAIMESLNLVGSTNRQDQIEHGMQMMGVNRYRVATEQANTPAGIAPHTDHSLITILVQSSSGLQTMDPEDRAWKTVPNAAGTLQVLVGDHLEVLSNGIYKGAFHRAEPHSPENSRFSIVTLLSFEMDEVVEPAMELVDEEHPKSYKGSSLRDFLKHLASNEAKPFVETLKIKP